MFFISFTYLSKSTTHTLINIMWKDRTEGRHFGSKEAAWASSAKLAHIKRVSWCHAFKIKVSVMNTLTRSLRTFILLHSSSTSRRTLVLTWRTSACGNSALWWPPPASANMSAQTGPDAARMRRATIWEDMKYVNRARTGLSWRSLCGAME